MKKIEIQNPFQYEEIARVIGDKISRAEYPADCRLPPIVELARSFAVHRLTMRRALKILESAGKLEMHRGQGTFVRDPNPAGLRMFYLGEMEAHFHKELFEALGTAARAAGYHLTGINPENENDSWIKGSISSARAVIVNVRAYLRVAGLLKEAGKRVVIVSAGRPSNTDFPAWLVTSDQSNAIAVAVEYLAGLGHRRIALVSGEIADEQRGVMPSSRSFRDVYAAYRAAMLSHDICDWHMSVLVRSDKQYEEEDLKNLAALMKKRDAPTAFVCEKDFRARLFYRLAAEAGLKIPRDFSIAGVYDTPWCTAWHPELTSVNMNQQALAQLALALCQQPAPRTETEFRTQPYLVKRGSCAPPGKYPK
jgi:DNA-binding LacI/PurR family transcriptional regulator